VVIDPLMAHLPAEVNSWRDESVRTALAPLYRMAEERDCSVVIVLHMNKARGADPLHRVGGSIGIPGAVRSALLLARDPDDPDGERGNRRVLAHVKSNVSELAPSLSYEIEPVLLPGDDRIETARLRLLGESERSGRSY
jgi:RecA-family ATPase